MLDANKVRLAIAPIAWTNDDLPDLGAENTFEQCISEMALSGFTGSEIGNKYPKDVETLKQKLAIRGCKSATPGSPPPCSPRDMTRRSKLSSSTAIFSTRWAQR